MLDPFSLQDLIEATGSIGRAVVGHQALHLNTDTAIGRQGVFKKAGCSALLLIRQHPSKRPATVIIDTDMDAFITSTSRVLATVVRYAVTGSVEARELLGVLGKV